MKDSGVSWIGEIPETWSDALLSSILDERKNKNKGMQEDNLLSLSYGNIVRKNINTNDGLLPASFEGYNIVESGDIVLRLTDLQNDHRSLRTGLCKERGIITSAYTTLKQGSNKHDSRYLHYYLHCFDLCKGFYGMGDGVRQGLSYDGIRKIPMLIPTEGEEKVIADFIDNQIGKVDILITNQQKQIERLKQYKQSLITEVVTKGLNTDVEMKDSGVEWVGKIPANARIIHLRHIVDIETGNMDTQNSTPDGEYPLYVRSPIVERCDTYTFDDEVAILMAGDGAGAGRIFHLVNGKYGCHQRVYRMNGFKYVIPKLIKYYLEVMFPILMEQGSAKSTVDSVRLPMLKSFPVVVMDDECQNKIVSYLDKKCSKIDSLIAIKQKKIEKLNQYKKSIVYEYVTGKKEA